jgi:hypothetical protein
LTTAEGRLKLYRTLRRGEKVGLEAGNLTFIVTKVVGCQIRVLNAHHLPVLWDG